LFSSGAEPDTFDDIYASKVIDKAQAFHAALSLTEIKFPQISFEYHYAGLRGTDKVSAKCLVAAEHLEVSLRAIYDKSEALCDFWGTKRLMAQCRRQKSYDLDLSYNEVKPVSDSYICLVGIGGYFDFITDEDGVLRTYLFNSNVRDYQGNTDVNKEIREALNLTDRQENFWWLNNGITIISAESSAGVKVNHKLCEHGAWSP